VIPSVELLKRLPIREAVTFNRTRGFIDNRLQPGDGASGTSQRRENARRDGTMRMIVFLDLRISVKHLRRVYAVGMAVCGVFGTPARALAQTDKWEVDVAPLYVWAATTMVNAPAKKLTAKIENSHFMRQ
jgi:hypothetical protein